MENEKCESKQKLLGPWNNLQIRKRVEIAREYVVIFGSVYFEFRHIKFFIQEHSVKNIRLTHSKNRHLNVSFSKKLLKTLWIYCTFYVRVHYRIPRTTLTISKEKDERKCMQNESIRTSNFTLLMKPSSSYSFSFCFSGPFQRRFRNWKMYKLKAHTFLLQKTMHFSSNM